MQKCLLDGRHMIREVRERLRPNVPMLLWRHGRREPLLVYGILVPCMMRCRNGFACVASPLSSI